MRLRHSSSRSVVLIACGLLIGSACSTVWISEAEQIISALLPGVANLVTLVGALDGSSVSPADLQTVQNAGAEAEADLQQLQSLITVYQKASTSAQPNLLNQIQTELDAVQSNLGGLMPALHIKDAATQAKVGAVIGVLLAEAQSVAAIVPLASGGAPAAMAAFAKQPVGAQLSAREFVKAYNATMKAKTGKAELDRMTASLQIHLHGKYVRLISAGWLE